MNASSIRLHPAFEARACLVMLLLVLVAAVVLLFDSPAPPLFRQLLTPDHNYAFIIVFIGAYVLWQRAPLIRKHSRGGSYLGVALIAAGLAIYYVYTVGHFLKLSYPALILIAFGAMLAWIGRGVIGLFVVPLLIFLLATPIADYFTLQVSITLQQVSSSLGTAILDGVGVPVYQDGNIIDLGTYQLQVAEACSGLRYLIPLGLLALCLIWLARAPLWGKLVTLAAVVPITIGLNSLRIALAGILVDTRGVGAAEGFMHFFEGWLIFAIAMVLLTAVLVAVASLSGRLRRAGDILAFERIEGEALMRDKPAAAATAASSAVPVSLVLGVALVVGVAGIAPAISTRDVVAPPRPAFWNFPMRVGDYVGVPQVVDDEVQLALQASDHLLADFSNPATGARVNFWVAYNEVQDMGTMLHSPKGCLPASGWEYERLERKTIDVAGAPSAHPFRVNEAIAVRGPERVALVYWMEARGRQLASEAWNKFYVFYDSMTRRRSDGALVRIVSSVEPGETDAQAFARIYDFVDDAYPHLRSYVAPST